MISPPAGGIGADLALVIVAVDDQQAAASFWTAFTGWPRTVDIPGGYTEYRAPVGTRFGLYARAPFAANFHAGPETLATGPTLATEAYLMVADAEEATRAAVALGAVLLDRATARAWGDTVAYLKAPGDFVVALAHASAASPA